MSRRTRGPRTPQQVEEIQAEIQQADQIDRVDQTVVSADEAPADPDQADTTDQQADEQNSLLPSGLAAIDWKNLTEEQQALAVRAANLIEEARPVLRNEGAAKIFAGLGGSTVEKIRKMRNQQTASRLIRPKKGETLAQALARQNSDLDEVIQKRAGALLVASGKDKTQAIKITPEQALAIATSEQEGVQATFVAIDKHNMGRRLVNSLLALPAPEDLQ